MIAVPVGETEVIVIESRGLDRGALRGYDRDVVNNGGVLAYTVDSSLKELPIRYAIDGGEGILDQSPIIPDKDFTYGFEKECRLVETPDSVAEKRIRPEFDYSGTQGTAVVKKYIDHPSLKLTANILDSDSQITLGPLVPNPVHTKEYIERLLREAGFHGPRVRISDIPYRMPFHH